MENNEFMKLIGSCRNEESSLEYIEQMKEKGFDVLKPTINKKLRAIEKGATYSKLTEDQVRFMLMIELNKTENSLDKIWEDEEFQDEFIVKVFVQRIKLFKLSEMVDPLLFAYGMFVFGIDSPGKGNIFLIKLLEHYHENGIAATQDDLTMVIFPEGFYTDESCRNIIDYCLKPKVTLFSELY